MRFYWRVNICVWFIFHTIHLFILSISDPDFSALCGLKTKLIIFWICICHHQTLSSCACFFVVADLENCNSFLFSFLHVSCIFLLIFKAGCSQLLIKLSVLLSEKCCNDILIKLPKGYIISYIKIISKIQNMIDVWQEMI